jgi:general secretion pathway protein A
MPEPDYSAKQRLPNEPIFIMYKAFFGLTDNPFSIVPDPKYFYMSERHSEALSHLLYGLNSGGGFVMLTGEVGTGKTTVSQCLKEQIQDHTILAFILLPTFSASEMLAAISDAFHVPYVETANQKQLFDGLHQFLLQAHQEQRQALLIIDEAQHLQPDVLEQLRLLTNLDVDGKKLLQIVLIGQPELQQLLSQPLLRQLAQRITARYHLLPLDVQELDAYVRFRLQVAGTLRPIFTPAAIRVLHKVSGGIPRLINLICERALLGAFALGQDNVDPALIEQAAFEVGGFRLEKTSQKFATFFVAGLVMLIAGWFGWQRWGDMPVVPVKELKTTVTLPPDQNVVDHFRKALGSAAYEDEAMQQLFRLWGYETAIDEATCDRAKAANLRCFKGQDSFEQMLAYNYPAVVHLRDKQLGDVVAVLVHRDNDQFDVLLNSEHWRVSTDWLKEHWDHSYTLLWQAPPSGNTLISKRSSPADVAWLEMMVGQATHSKIRDHVTRYDATLLENVRRFQREHQLGTDGIAGENTLMLLTNQSRSLVPRLNGRIPALQAGDGSDRASTSKDEQGAQ